MRPDGSTTTIASGAPSTRARNVCSPATSLGGLTSPAGLGRSVDMGGPQRNPSARTVKPRAGAPSGGAHVGTTDDRLPGRETLRHRVADPGAAQAGPDHGQAPPVRGPPVEG